MPIQYFGEDKFIFWPDASHTPSLGIESERLQKCLAEVKRRGLKGVFGTLPYFRESNLDFLAAIPWVEAVEFWEVKLKNLIGLYTLTNLQFLRLSGSRPPINFESLPNLRSLVWEFNPMDSGYESLPLLEQLHLWRYKSTTKTFKELPLPNNLKAMEIIWSDVTILDDLSFLPKLTHLEINRCRNLISLGDLAEKCPNLESLFIVSSGRLQATEAERVAANLPRLRHLVAANKLIIDPSSGNATSFL